MRRIVIDAGKIDRIRVRRVGRRSGKPDDLATEALRLVENERAGPAGEVDYFAGGRVDDQGSAIGDRRRHRRRVDNLGNAATINRGRIECVPPVTAADGEEGDGVGAVEQSEDAVVAVVAGAGNGALVVDHVA